MGFWDKDVHNSIDRMFDYNHDGHLNTFEQAMEYDFYEEGLHDEDDDEEETEEENDLYSDLDLGELADMDEDERKEALEDAGYDPDDFDDMF